MRTIDGNYIVWAHDIYSVTAIEGTIVRPLEGLLQSSDKVEFGRSRIEPRENNREFLAGWHYKPPLDITLTSYPDGNASISVVALDKELGRATVEELVAKTQLFPRAPRREFQISINQQGMVELETLKFVKNASDATERPLADWWGFVHYLHFLTSYRGVSHDDATDRGCTLYGIPKSIFKKR